MIPHAPLADDRPLRRAVGADYHADETACVARLLADFRVGAAQRRRIDATARRLVQGIRAAHGGHGGLDTFLQEYKLSSDEGVALMCLAEALLRIPDAGTADALIEDKLAGADWKSHLGHSESLLVNLSTWGLMLTGKMIAHDRATADSIGAHLAGLLARSGEPMIRAAVVRAMKIIGRQFVLAEDIHAALRAARRKQRQGYAYSYDMLGEAARTAADAQRYFDAYREAIEAIGAANARDDDARDDGGDDDDDPLRADGLSVKLSALHPRYEYAQSERVLAELLPRIQSLCAAARKHGIAVTIDAEESERLDPSLSVLQALSSDPDLRGWDGLGFVVQAYQKRASAVVDYLEELASKSKRKLMIRLVKGAYWDREIKQAQVHGFADYPVFTRKAATDVSYLYCAQKLLARPACFRPLFATHNAHSVASILVFAGKRRDFEFQCLHGMGEMLYDPLVGDGRARCRIYAPVGSHRDLLAYLVRRLLENGANSSFVNRLVDKELPIARIIQDPARTLAHAEPKPHPNLPPPPRLYPDRANSCGMNLFDCATLEAYYRAVESLRGARWQARPTTPSPDDEPTRESVTITNPATGATVGDAQHADARDIEHAVASARAAADDWDHRGGAARAELLETAAELYQRHRDELLYLCAVEAGKTVPDAVAELREAIDFLRYYATCARRDFAAPRDLHGPTGERNQLSLHGRGVFACISPWNFPLAIFTGQTGAALAAGNCVIAKPAEQTPLIAARAVALLHQAGVPRSALHCLPGDGAVGARLAADARVDGVAFTGSTATAKRIQLSLAQTAGPIRKLIAETGGVNAMIVDSSALPEQVVGDVIASSFQSAGQRCSAVRVLYLQREVADGIIEMLCGAMMELRLGDPLAIATDVGPIIDRAARERLRAHVAQCRRRGRKVVVGARADDSHDADCARGCFFSPTIIEIDGIADLDAEVFGPVLHIARFDAADLERVVDDINARGHGLTFGLHTRIHSTAERVAARIKVGNAYINRNTIGAVVGVQPFGGEGLSGTGPKAGGPQYLHAFALERAISTDTTAAGGNASLLSMESMESS